MALKSGTVSPFLAVRYALRLLETVAARPEGVPEETLAKELELPPQQFTQLLQMLRREDYVLKQEDGAYSAGDALLRLGATGEIRERAQREKLADALDRLRGLVGAAVYIGMYSNGEMTIPHASATAEQPAVNQWVDFKVAAHATAVGKCLLSQLDHDGRQDHFSRHKAARLTSRTITDRRVLLSTLERQPATMPMLDIQEYAVGTLCAAVPLTAGASVGCLGLSLPIGEAHRLRKAAEVLNEQAAPTLLTLAL